MEYGFTSDIWMARQIIKGSDPAYVKLAVIRLFEAMWEGAQRPEDQGMSVLEIFDRLIQVSSTGEFHPPQDVRSTVEQAIKAATEVLDDTYLSDDDKEQAVRDMCELLGVEPDEDWKWDEDDGLV